MKIFRMSNAKLLTKIVKAGEHFTVGDLHQKISDFNHAALNRRVASMVKAKYIHRLNRGVYAIPSDKMEALKKSVERELPTIYKAESIARRAMSEVLAPDMTFTKKELMILFNDASVKPSVSALSEELVIAIGDYLTKPSIGVYHIDNTGFLKLKCGIGYNGITGIEQIDLNFIRSILPGSFSTGSILLSLKSSDIHVFDVAHLRLALAHLVEIGELTKSANMYSKATGESKRVVNLSELDKLLFCN